MEVSGTEQKGNSEKPVKKTSLCRGVLQIDASKPLGRLRVLVILTLVLTALVSTVTAVVWAIWGDAAAIASVTAGVVCWLGGLGACAWRPGEVSVAESLSRLLGGIALRAGFPLAVGISVQIVGGALAKAGFLYYLLMFYLATLGVETYLFVPRGRPPRRKTRSDAPENESR